MLFTFRYRTGSLVDIVEGEYITDAPDLTLAVTEFKHFIRANRTSAPFVVSYFYICECSDKTFLGEFTDDFYHKHFGGFNV